MRALVSVLLLSLLVVPVAASQARSGPAEDAVAAVIAQYNRGLNEADLNAITGAFGDEGVFMPPNQQPVSGAALRQWYETYHSRTIAKLQFTPMSIRVEGSLAYAVVKISGTTTPKSGGPSVQQDNKALFVLRRGANGRWTIAHYMLNSNKRS